MPEVNGPDKESREKRQFMREKIVKPPLTRKQIAKRVLACLSVAVLCGAAAGLAFGVVRPLAERYLVPEETQESDPITIPKDDPPETSPVMPETTTQEPKETEPIEEILQSAIERYEYTADDLVSMYSTLRSVSLDADKGIVVVHSVKREVDWFDNPVETTGLYAGAVIASTARELLIMTPDSAVENADSIKVTFGDGVEVNGIIKQADKVSGMAVVSVDATQLDETTLESVTALKLGNSYAVKQGDIIIALGSPAGMAHSVNYGFVSYVLRNVQVADGMTRLLYTDVKGNADKGTFLVNASGEMIGWVTDQYKNEGSEGMTVVMAISDYKSILEKMTNGIPVPYLGMKGQEVTTAMTENGLPLGVYVTDSIADGPAYNAGIQNGDIITRIGEMEITAIKDYQNAVESLKEGESVNVIIQRNGIEEYKELEYQVTVGAR